MPTYERFVALIPRILYFLTLLFCCTLRKRSKIAYIDSTSLKVCHPKRIYRNKVFKGLAKKGKSTKGWFFGFKLHIIIDDKGNLMNAKLTKGNVDEVCSASNDSRYEGLFVCRQRLYQQGFVSSFDGSRIENNYWN